MVIESIRRSSGPDRPQQEAVNAISPCSYFIYGRSQYIDCFFYNDMVDCECVWNGGRWRIMLLDTFIFFPMLGMLVICQK